MATRTFVAITLDDPILRRLAKAQESLRAADADVRWVERANLHLTLKFLGTVEDRELHEVCAVAEEAAADIEAFDFGILGLEAAPPAGQMRMIWAKIEEPTGRLAQLAERLEEAYGELGFKQEHRAYHPHLTVGRVKTGRNVLELRRALTDFAETGFGVQGVGEIVVYSSQLTPDGPVYAPLVTAPLGC